MIRIQQLLLQVGHTERELEDKIRRILRLDSKTALSYEIRKRSVDARKKPNLYYSYVIDCKTAKEQRICRRAKGGVSLVEEKPYRFPAAGDLPLSHPPVIIGTGPAGLFCGLLLAKHGYRPILLERGQDVDTRLQDVAVFWETGRLNPSSNVQFGEGGAGTFSDGKLNTLIRDRDGRNREVLRLFVEAGADPSILYDSKPHLGTDVLAGVVRQIRKQILQYGGRVRFGAEVTGLTLEDNKIRGVIINHTELLPCQLAVLAIGHSARDTFGMLYDAGLKMEAKEFAAGFRVEHRQEKINLAQYGMSDPAPLGAAPYKVTAQAGNGRGVYSFCMCPGGYVVNASSEEGRLAVNGMSYHGRAGENANSAIIVSVKTSDFGSEHPLAGIAFQRRLEEAAYQAGGGRIPVQRLGEFRSVFASRTVLSAAHGRMKNCSFSCKLSETGEREDAGEQIQKLRPCMKGTYVFSDLTGILPKEMTEAFLDGMEQFARKIKGFADEDTLVSAVESRTSSPVRILRDETLQSSLKGLYPCGEGAGYAGGITSAAMDGIRVAEAVRIQYRPYEDGMKKKQGGSCRQPQRRNDTYE